MSTVDPDEVRRLKSLVGFDGEIRVAGAEHLINDQDVRLDRGRGGKLQARAHAKRIGLDRLMKKFAKFAEFHYVLKSRFDFDTGQAIVYQRCADILRAGEIGMEADAGRHQRLDCAVDDDLPGRRREVSRYQLEQRRLARAVASDDSDALAAPNVEVDAVERRENPYGRTPPEAKAEKAEHVKRLFADTVVEFVFFAHAAQPDGGRRRRFESILVAMQHSGIIEEYDLRAGEYPGAKQK